MKPLDIIAGNDDDRSMRYPGGKGKCYQHIINVLPPHLTYIETHLGGGAVLLHKKPARMSIGVDRDPAVIRSWQHLFPSLASYIEGDAVEFLASHRLSGDDLVYCDPPYLPSTRRRARVYRHDYGETDHVRLLETLRKLPCRVVVSGYPSELYDEFLSGWQSQRYSAKAHDGIRQEKIWFNFDTPVRLHDTRHLGRDFRERQTIKRRLQRLQTRISTLSPQEQQFLSEWLDDHLQEEDCDAGFLLPKE
jgi:site-specific DNA-adenine methylase